MTFNLLSINLKTTNVRNMYHWTVDQKQTLIAPDFASLA